MTENWEYCRLSINELEFREDKKKNKTGWRCGLSIRYMGNIQTKETLCDNEGRRDKNNRYYILVYPENPWAIAIGILGSIGWELVSVQHGNSEFAHLANEAMAYFKRPVREGRQINEPKLSIPYDPEIWYL